MLENDDYEISLLKSCFIFANFAFSLAISISTSTKTKNFVLFGLLLTRLVLCASWPPFACAYSYVVGVFTTAVLMSLQNPNITREKLDKVDLQNWVGGVGRLACTLTWPYLLIISLGTEALSSTLKWNEMQKATLVSRSITPRTQRWSI